jgi:hypothetical protein
VGRPRPDQPPAKGSGKKALDTYLRQIKRANPASFVTITDLRRAYKAASAEPWVFLRQNANQWVTQDFAAIDKVGWLAGDCGEKLQIPAGVTGVYVGLDTASKWATTAITPVWVDPKTKRPRCCGAVILKSTHRGAQRRLRDAIDVLEVMRARWPRMTVVFDRNYGGGLIAEQLEEDHGLTVVDHGQGLEFDLASMLFGELVDQHGFDHDGNKDLTAQVLAAVARRSRYGRRWRIDQPRDGRPIDAADAVVMATNIALNPPDEPPRSTSTTTASPACDPPRAAHRLRHAPRPGGDRRPRAAGTRHPPRAAPARARDARARVTAPVAELADAVEQLATPQARSSRRRRRRAVAGRASRDGAHQAPDDQTLFGSSSATTPTGSPSTTPSTSPRTADGRCPAARTSRATTSRGSTCTPTSPRPPTTHPLRRSVPLIYDGIDHPVEIAPGGGDLRYSSVPIGGRPSRVVGPDGRRQAGQLRELFATQPWVAAAVMRMLSWSIRVPLKAYRRTGDDSRERLAPQTTRSRARSSTRGNAARRPS